MHASETPSWTRSRAAAAAAAILGKEETATVDGSSGASLRVAVVDAPISVYTDLRAGRDGGFWETYLPSRCRAFLQLR